MNWFSNAPTRSWCWTGLASCYIGREGLGLVLELGQIITSAVSSVHAIGLYRLVYDEDWLYVSIRFALVLGQVYIHYIFSFGF